MPFSAAEATNRRAKSASTGREPTRKRPRSASPSGVFTRAFSARMRSHGLSTPRLTAAVEAAAAGDLEIREAGAVEDLREPELLGGRHLARERLLPEQADGRVGEGRHGRDLTAPQDVASARRRAASIAARPSRRPALEHGRRPRLDERPTPLGHRAGSLRRPEARRSRRVRRAGIRARAHVRGAARDADQSAVRLRSTRGATAVRLAVGDQRQQRRGRRGRGAARARPRDVESGRGRLAGALAHVRRR